MYSETLIRPRRPRRTMDHLFGDDADLIPAEVLRQQFPNYRSVDESTVARPPRLDASVMGDAPAPVNPVLPPVRPARPIDAPPLELTPTPPEPVTLANIGAPPPAPTRPAPPDYIAEDAAALRAAQSAPVERSRLKSAGVGFLRGGIPGLIGGVLQPDLYGEVKRSRAIKRAEAQLGTDLDLRRARSQDLLLQSQIDENKAQADARKRPPRPILGREVQDDGTTIQTELNPETGVFEPSTRDGKPIVLSRAKAAEPMVEMTLSDGRKVMVSPSSALGADATRTGRLDREQTKADERESQRLAAQDEFDQLTADEANAGIQKNAAYAYLAELKANPNVSQDDINEARKAAETANTLYQSYATKKAAAKAKITRYLGGSRPDRPTQKTLPPGLEQKIRAAATQRGLNPDIAIEKARARL